MAITVVRTIPENETTEVYIDYNLLVQFSKQIEGSYLNSDYFKIYRTNQGQTEFFETMELVLTQDGTTVEINPSVFMQKLCFYMLIVTGGAEGIRSIDNDTLESNIVISFSTGSGVGPANITVDPTPSNSAFGSASPSYDVFASSGINTPISLIGSVPENKSVGITDIDRIILYYNDTIFSGSPIPPNSYSFKEALLPVDPDPFANNIIPGELSIYNDQLIYDTEYNGTTENTEFTFRIQPMAVRGTTRQARDAKAHIIKFMGPLNPVYATPEQIIRRLVGYGIDANDISLEYDIWKAIHEVSLMVREIYAGLMDTASIYAINRLTICLVLRELLLGSALFEGGIKMRQLLATKVEYEATNWDQIANQLDQCIRDSTPESRATILTNIKSGTALSNSRGYNTKIYGVYR